jgi:hypothetical protein
MVRALSRIARIAAPGVTSTPGRGARRPLTRPSRLHALFPIRRCAVKSPCKHLISHPRGRPESACARRPGGTSRCADHASAPSETQCRPGGSSCSEACSIRGSRTGEQETRSRLPRMLALPDFRRQLQIIVFGARVALSAIARSGGLLLGRSVYRKELRRRHPDILGGGKLPDLLFHDDHGVPLDKLIGVPVSIIPKQH